MTGEAAAAVTDAGAQNAGAQNAGAQNAGAQNAGAQNAGAMARALLAALGMDAALADPVAITGAVPELRTPFRVAEVSAAVLAAQAALIVEIARRKAPRKDGAVQTASVALEAAALALQSVFFQRVWNYPVMLTEPDYPTVAVYPTLDERFIMINGGYPKLRDGLLRLLRCADDAGALGAAIARWPADDLEAAIADRGLCGVVARTPAEWRAHPQGEAIAGMKLVETLAIGEAPPVPLPAGPRPLEGLKVLDLTHVIAGPTIGKCLAEQGAAVLHVYDPMRPQLPPFDMDTGHGKHSCFLDLEKQEDAARLEALAAEADVVVQSYRPGSLAARGFSAERFARLRPGVIVVSVGCYGFAGPWRLRPGFEQLAQIATGMATIQGTEDQPMLCPGFYPNDYLTGFLGACGVLAGLLARSEAGGSRHVRVSLCRTAMHILEAGLLPEAPRLPVDPALIAGLMRSAATPIGEMHFLGPVIEYSASRSAWARPPVPLGADPAAWP